jgi:RimJ/RimL family protein N-acetyltransferase
VDRSPQSERLRLRFVTGAEVPLLRGRYAHEAGGFNDFDLPTDPGERDTTPRKPPIGELRNDDTGVLFVELRDVPTPIGTIEYRRVRYGPNPESAAWMIGIELLPEARGRGYGAEAQRLLADWLLDTTGANRVEAQTDVDNVAEGRSLARAGFTREGVLRGAQFRGGRHHDVVVFSRIRSDRG